MCAPCPTPDRLLCGVPRALGNGGGGAPLARAARLSSPPLPAPGALEGAWPPTARPGRMRRQVCAGAGLITSGRWEAGAERRVGPGAWKLSLPRPRQKSRLPSRARGREGTCALRPRVRVWGRVATRSGRRRGGGVCPETRRWRSSGLWVRPALSGGWEAAAFPAGRSFLTRRVSQPPGDAARTCSMPSSTAHRPPPTPRAGRSWQRLVFVRLWAGPLCGGGGRGSAARLQPAFEPGVRSSGTPAAERVLAVGSDGGVALGPRFLHSPLPPHPRRPVIIIGHFPDGGFKLAVRRDRSPESHLATIFSPLCHSSLCGVGFVLGHTIPGFVSSDFAGFSEGLLGFLRGLLACH